MAVKSDIKELMKKVRLIEIRTRKEVDSFFAGGFHSKFQGQGIDFTEVREYVDGDDIRSIDWKVSARLNSLFVRKYTEERELNLVMAVDMSSSMFFGSNHSIKKDMVAEIVSILGFSALKDDNKAGLLMFGDKVEKFIPCNKGRNHMMLIIREIFEDFKTKEADFYNVVRYLNNILKRRSIIVLISDFLAPLDEELIKKMRVLSKKHEVMAIRVTDQREYELVSSGIVRFNDIETGRMKIVNTSSKKFREYFKTMIDKKREEQNVFFKKTAIKNITVDTGKNYLYELMKLFV